MPVRLGGHLLGLGQQRFHLAQVEQRVPALLLLHDAGHDVALASGELLVRHLAFGVTELLEDHLLGGLGADAALEVVGDLDLFLAEHLHLEGWVGAFLLGRHLDLLEILLPHAQVAALGVDLGAEADEVVVCGGVLLLPPRLVGRGHRFAETVQDGLEGDALLAFQLPQRGDHLGVHALLLFSSALQSTTVLADVMSAYGTRSSASPIARVHPSSSAAISVPAWIFDPSTCAFVFTLTCSPTHRR